MTITIQLQLWWMFPALVTLVICGFLIYLRDEEIALFGAAVLILLWLVLLFGRFA